MKLCEFRPAIESLKELGEAEKSMLAAFRQHLYSHRNPKTDSQSCKSCAGMIRVHALIKDVIKRVAHGIRRAA